MRIAGRETTYKTFSGENQPTMTVRPGEIFAVDTELCSGAWLRSADDLWSREKSNGPNPCVCIGVEGAEPGDTLAVEILDIAPENLGYTAMCDQDLVGAILGHPTEVNSRTVRIEDGFVLWSDTLRLPVKPMVGTIGTAAPEGLRTSYAGYSGGNMDIQEATVGTILYLPVSFPLGLLHVGDTHAMQGDGEIDCAGGIECRSRVTLRVQVIKGGIGANCVWAETERELMTVACLGTTDESFTTACGELIRFIRSRYEVSEEECYQLLGQVMSARCTQYVNPTRTYVCKAPKQFFSAAFPSK